jgi:hypothetical protein
MQRLYAQPQAYVAFLSLTLSVIENLSVNTHLSVIMLYAKLMFMIFSAELLKTYFTIVLSIIQATFLSLPALPLGKSHARQIFSPQSRKKDFKLKNSVRRMPVNIFSRLRKAGYKISPEKLAKT